MKLEPLEKNQVIKSTEIIDLDVNARGIAKINGEVVFVRNTLPGDCVDIKLIKKTKKIWEAIPVHFQESSPDRVNPSCKHFGICGGCKLRHYRYEAQLKWKRKFIYDNLSRIGGINNPDVPPVIPSPRIDFYRNKLEFTFSARRWITQEEIDNNTNVETRKGLGFHLPGRFDTVLNIEQCFLQENISNEIRNFVREYALLKDYEFYNFIKHQGFLRNLIIRTAEPEQVMVIMVFAQPEKNKIDDILGALTDRFPNISSLYYFINTKRNDSLADL